MWNRKHRRMVKRLVLSLAVFAALAPAAEARVDEISNITTASGQRTDEVVRPDDRATRFSLSDSDQAVARPDDWAARFSPNDSNRVVLFSPSDAVKYVAVGGPDGRFVRTDAIGLDPVSTRPDDKALRPMLEPATDYLGRPEAVILREGPKWDGNKPSDVVVAGDGFDWSDAGIGAATLFGALLLAGTAVLLVRGNRKLASV